MIISQNMLFCKRFFKFFAYCLISQNPRSILFLCLGFLTEYMPCAIMKADDDQRRDEKWKHATCFSAQRQKRLQDTN